MADRELYLKEILARAPQALSMLNREPSSGTYGCFDRNFWQWKFVDFPGARFQEGVWALAGLYLEQSPKNPFYQSPSLMEWIEAALMFWRRVQNPDGSFDEAYPGERSFVATGFSLLAVTETLLLLEKGLDSKVAIRVERAVVRAARWLCRNDEPHAFISNHRLGSAAALYNAYTITGNGRFLTRCKELLASVYLRQSQEGWFLEYTGPDPGYETQGIFYLAHYLSRSRDPEPLDRIARSVGFLKHFVHPDGSLGGEYGSRNTQFYFPGGLEIVARHIEDAARVASFMRKSIEEGRCASLGSVDPYNLFPLMSSFLRAHQAQEELEVGPGLPFEEPFSRTFDHAGILVESTGSYYMVCNLKKAGLLKAFSKADMSKKYSSCGPYIRTAGGKVATPVRYLPERSYIVGEGLARVEGSFYVKNETEMTPLLFMLFRLFMLTLGRLPAVARLIKKRLANRLILEKTVLPITFDRTVRLFDDSIEVRDRVGTVDREVFAAASLTELHMGSSKYFHTGLLAEEPGTVKIDMTDKRTIVTWLMEF